tara:strand:+ start:12364 stop:12807 length:444 start_codon:yes stop_codon:yes gene_type:complete
MSNEILWGEYVPITTLALVAYYGSICFWIYLHKMKVPAAKDHRPPTNTSGTGGTDYKDLFINASEETFQKVESLKERLREMIKDSFYKKLGRRALLENLSSALDRYPELIGTPFQEGIDRFIMTECNKHGPVGIREKELKELWIADS